MVVTGASGFLGRALCARCEETGHSYRALLRRASEGGVPESAVRVVGDLASAPDATLADALAGASAVVHLAGRAHVLRENTADPEGTYRAANVVATERIAHAARRAGVARFILASTVKVNGEASPRDRPLRPDDPPRPADAYARSKWAAEQALARIAAGGSMSAIVLRLPLCYGPGVAGNFGALLSAIAHRRILPLGAAHARRSLLYAGNFVDAIEAALASAQPPAGVHFVADAEPVSVAELARAIGIALGEPARLIPLPVGLLRLAARLAGRGPDADRLTSTLEVDFASFAVATAWSPRIGLAEGLAATTTEWRRRRT